MTKNKAKQELYGECLAYIIFGQDIHPTHVEDMIKKSFKAGYEEAMEYQELEKENENYEQALEFYGNEGNYKTVIENDREIKFLGTSVAQMDGGELARKVLESSGSEGDLDE